MPTVKLSKDALAIAERAYDRMRPEQRAETTLVGRLSYVVDALLQQWDTTEEMFGGEEEGERVALSGDVEEQLRSITEPDISFGKLGVAALHDKTTPQATDGLVPWEYVCAGYPKLVFVADALSDYTDLGERRVQTIRTVLTRIPEDQWESEQTRSIVAKALSQVGDSTTKNVR